ncbi:Rhs family protein [Candidatus Magnetomorum sp. HK-1]|nr:Rhs family protein [Candidatus Magnetomorum sp. HK-1]
MAAFAIPLIWPAVVAAAEAAAAVAIAIAGAIVVTETIEAVDDALQERERGKAREKSTDKTCVENCGNKCPPCVPPVGLICVERVDQVPPSRPHAPCPGDHAHLVQRNQAPYPDCRCFWNKARPDVLCLEPGEKPPYPRK